MFNSIGLQYELNKSQSQILFWHSIGWFWEVLGRRWNACKAVGHAALLAMGHGSRDVNPGHSSYNTNVPISYTTLNSTDITYELGYMLN